MVAGAGATSWLIPYVSAVDVDCGLGPQMRLLSGPLHRWPLHVVFLLLHAMVTTLKENRVNIIPHFMNQAWQSHSFYSSFILLL